MGTVAAKLFKSNKVTKTFLPGRIQNDIWIYKDVHKMLLSPLRYLYEYIKYERRTTFMIVIA